METTQQMTNLQQSQARAVGSKNPRAYSTKLEDHSKLIHMLTHKFLARIAGAGCHAMDYEDLYQHACITYTKAQSRYKPEYGITFTAYLGRAIMNDMNKLLEKLLNEHLGLGIIYGEDMSDSEDSVSVYENFASDDEGVEERLERMGQARENLRNLDAVSRLYVRILMQPPAEFKEFLASKGYNYIKLSYIAQWRKDPVKTLRKVRKDLAKTYNINTSHL